MLNLDLGTCIEIGGKRFIETKSDVQGHVVYGPYDRLDAGEYVVSFQIMRANDEIPLNPDCPIVIDVAGQEGTVTYSRHRVHSARVLYHHTFLLPFRLPSEDVVEYRVYVEAQPSLLIGDNPEVRKMSDIVDFPEETVSLVGFPNTDVRPCPTVLLDQLSTLRKLHEGGASVEVKDRGIVRVSRQHSSVDVRDGSDIATAIETLWPDTPPF